MLFKNIKELGVEDIVDDLSRVQNLLEARKPTYKAIYSHVDGKLFIDFKDEKYILTITSSDFLCQILYRNQS